jgi:hypothetical protein
MGNNAVYFGGKYLRCLQSRSVSQARNQQKLVPCLAYSPTLKMEAMRLAVSDVHNVTTQKTIVFKPI